MNEAIQIISAAEAAAHLLNELANGVKQSFYHKTAHAARLLPLCVFVRRRKLRFTNLFLLQQSDDHRRPVDPER
jgi:hypothetical protein